MNNDGANQNGGELSRLFSNDAAFRALEVRNSLMKESNFQCLLIKLNCPM